MAKQPTDLFCQRTAWNGRRAYLLANDRVRLVTLVGGGHIAEFRFVGSTGLPTLNPLWNPPWKTIEPYRYRAKLHASRYGPSTEGKLLSGIAGHSICLDYFGPPSPEEAAHGLSYHGEAPSARWKKSHSAVNSQEVSLTLSVRLPVAGLKFSREVKLRRGESVVYFEEIVTNERKADHFFHWTQHVTLGSLFLSHRGSNVTLPGKEGMTYPHGYDEGKALLAPGRRFQWPKAPARGEGTVDLTRPFLRRGFGFVVTVLLDSNKELGFVAALNYQHRLLVGYCFRRCDFPWVTVWEENRAIAALPWKRRTQARGLEFGTGALPILRREAFAMGSLFDTPTFTAIPARGRRAIRYAAFLCQVPSDFGSLVDVRAHKQEILLRGTSRNHPVHLSASGLLGLF